MNSNSTSCNVGSKCEFCDPSMKHKPPSTNGFSSFWSSASPNYPLLRAVLWIAIVAFPYVVLFCDRPRSFMSSFCRPLMNDDGMLHTIQQADPAAHGGILLQPYPKGHNWTLLELLQAASMPDRTVIITAINHAWADSNNSMIDLFLESLHRGADTASLLNHLLILALDAKAYERCVEIHPYCFAVETEGQDFSAEKNLRNPDYKKLMWRRLEVLKDVLDNGYSILFTDTDVIWLRNPFPHFSPYIDIHISTDNFNGNSTDLWNNILNTGFFHAKANEWTVNLYEQWVRIVKGNTKLTDQSGLNWYKRQPDFSKIGLRMRVLDTRIFAGFCSKKATDYAKLTTMHATCCIGLQPKLQDLREILDDYWTKQRLNQTHVSGSSILPRFAPACDRSWQDNKPKL